MTKTTYQLCLAYLRWSPPERRPEAANAAPKTAKYGVAGRGGSNEPDHAIDPIVEEVDLARALSAVDDLYLQAIGVDTRRFQDVGTVVRRARAADPWRWEDLRRCRRMSHPIVVVPNGANFDVQCPCGWQTTEYTAAEAQKVVMRHLDPLREALERCAMQMAAVLGPFFGAKA